MALPPPSASGLTDTTYMPSCRNITPLRCQPQTQNPISPQHNPFHRKSLYQSMNHISTLLAKTPHNPRQIPTSNPPSQNMNDVVAVLSDPFFFLSDAQHELSKRRLNAFGRKDDLLRRLFEALEAEYAEGWTLGYLLNTKILPHSGKGRDARSLVGHHVEGYECDGDGVVVLALSDGEDVAVFSDNRSGDRGARIKMDHDLFWALHVLDGMRAVPRDLVKKPLLITEAVMGVRKNRWGKEAGTVFGLKLEGMRAISFFFLAGEVFVREDRTCGDVWLAGNDVLREDLGLLHGGDEVVVEEVRERQVTEGEIIR